MTPLLTPSQVAELLGVSRRTVQRLAADGELPGLRIGSQWRFREQTVRTWVVDREAAADWERRSATSSRTEATSAPAAATVARRPVSLPVGGRLATTRQCSRPYGVRRRTMRFRQPPGVHAARGQRRAPPEGQAQAAHRRREVAISLESIPDDARLVQSLTAQIAERIMAPTQDALRPNHRAAVGRTVRRLISQGRVADARALVADEISVASLSAEISRHMGDCFRCADDMLNCETLRQLEQRETRLMHLMARAGSV